MTRQQAIELARRFAKAKPQSYYSEPFMPHEWVIDAIVAAYLKGCYQPDSIDADLKARYQADGGG